MHTTLKLTQANSQSELVTVLTALIAENLPSVRTEDTVIQAGHYHLGWKLIRPFDPCEEWNPGTAYDLFDSDSNNQFALVDNANFAKSTWWAACLAIKQSGSSAKLMTLVNDWQYLQLGLGNIRQRETEAAMLRTGYYKRMPTMPSMHLQALVDNGLDSDVIFKESSSRWLFSEKKLRYNLNRTLHRMLRDIKNAELIGLRRELTDKNEPVIYATTEDNQEYKLLYCGHTGCAGEVVQLLSELQTRHIRNFINLYPIECRDPVGAGTRLAQNLFALDDMKITNIAIKPLQSGGAEICTEKF
jgi:hypothetical protein